jgi:hypothetical protein
MIFTGYYAKLNSYKNLGLEPIAISGKRPDFYEGLYYPNFAPRYWMYQRWKNKDITNEGYVEEYKAYLNTLNISIQPLTSQPPCRFSKAEMRAILAEATAEARSGQGTSHEDFKREMASWL